MDEMVKAIVVGVLTVVISILTKGDGNDNK